MKQKIKVKNIKIIKWKDKGEIEYEKSRSWKPWYCTHTHTHTILLENNRINSRKIAENKIAELAIRNKDGITLIALVITIIVLLILAGVSIAMLTGTNGILTQAQKAKMTTELSSYKEQLEVYKTEKLSENREFLESTFNCRKRKFKI